MPTAPAADAHTAERTTPPVTATDRLQTCELELEVASRMIHRTLTKHGAQEARESAWKAVCAVLQSQHDIDCRDPDQVTVVSDAPRSPSYVSDDGTQYYGHELVLTVRKVVTGVGEAPEDRQEACRRAKAHACEQLLAAACPETGVRVISVDGKPPDPAAVEPVPEPTAPRETI